MSSTVGVDLFEEDIDNVIFSTNEFLCNQNFIGPSGPFFMILQFAMSLAVVFSLIVAGSMAYKMMVKGEPFDPFKILRILGIALIMCWWYPPAWTGLAGTSSKTCMLDILAYVPNCIGSYTHDLYEEEAVQVNEKYGKMMELVNKRDSLYNAYDPQWQYTKDAMSNQATTEALNNTDNPEGAIKSGTQVQENAKKSTYAGFIIALDKIVIFLALVIYRIGWWSTIFCQQILLGMLTIFGPIMWAFSILPKWEGAWAKWLIRYLTVHFYGAMLYFVGFYVLLLFDIVLSVQVENLTAIAGNLQTITGYVQNVFMTAGYLLAASVVSLKCLNLVPDLAGWMIPEGESSYSTRNFGEGVAASVKGSAMNLTGMGMRAI
ncbi:MAG: hypothetical protein PUF37_00985 [Prevotellaceae bacterium]|nr:hypothetical protein [Prevotellaceae bacterium]